MKEKTGEEDIKSFLFFFKLFHPWPTWSWLSITSLKLSSWSAGRHHRLITFWLILGERDFLQHVLSSLWQVSIFLASDLHLARWALRLRIHQIPLRNVCCFCQYIASWSPAEFFSDLLFLLCLKNFKFFNFFCNFPFSLQLCFAVFSYIVLSIVLWSSDASFVITSDASTHPNLSEAVLGGWIWRITRQRHFTFQWIQSWPGVILL